MVVGGRHTFTKHWGVVSAFAEAIGEWGCECECSLRGAGEGAPPAGGVGDAAEAGTSDIPFDSVATCAPQRLTAPNFQE